MLITQKGQITIPLEIREKFGFIPHTDMTFVIENDRVYLERATSPFKKIKGIMKGKFTTDDIMKLTRHDHR